jgi:predicted DNA-binding transcriptional regulator AlpA
VTRDQAAPPALWDRRRAAAEVGISPRTLEHLDREGKGPRRVKIGGAVRYDPIDVRAWIEANRLPTGEGAA